MREYEATRRGLEHEVGPNEGGGTTVGGLVGVISHLRQSTYLGRVQRRKGGVNG